MGEVRNCGICRGDRLKTILDLGKQPMAERDDGHTYPLELMECTQCGLVQLSCAVDQHEMFPPDHPYATGNTRALREHFDMLAAQLTPLISPGDLVVDIGANDGTFLAAVRRHTRDARLLAVEPTGQAARCREKMIPVTQDFWTASLARDTHRWLGPAKVITAANVLAHVPDPHDFMSGVSSLLADDGVLVTENHDWGSVVNGLQIDTIYHEHLRYYSLASLGHLLAMHGFLIEQAERITTHGGSFRVRAVRQQGGLGNRVAAVRDKLATLIQRAAEDGPVYGIGATTRATPLIHYAGLAPYLACVCERTGSDKIGRNMPGTAIPVVDEQKLIDDQPPYALLLAWHITADLVPALRQAGYEGRFITPLPEPGILHG